MLWVLLFDSNQKKNGEAASIASHKKVLLWKPDLASDTRIFLCSHIAAGD